MLSTLSRGVPVACLPGRSGAWEEPLYPPEELRGLAPDLSRGAAPAPHPLALIARLVDGSRFEEFKASFGTTLVTGGCAGRAQGGMEQ